MSMSTTIHKTSIINKATKLGNNLVIAAYSIIGPNFKIGNK